MSEVSRRSMLTWTGAAGVTGVVAGVAGDRLVTGSDDAAADPAPTSGSGDGPGDSGETSRLAPYDHTDADDRALPAGLGAAVPAFGHVLALDLTPRARATPRAARTATIALLRHLTALADQAVTGDGDLGSGPSAREVAGLDVRPAGLQVTPGFGVGLLEACGLEARRPEALIDLPVFATDHLQPALSGGDLLVQLGAEDPMRLAGALQVVASGLGGAWWVRWSRPGFRRSVAGAVDVATTARNLMGHRDGTANEKPGSALWRATVLAREPSGPASWIDGGSYLVARQIRIDLAAWFTHPEAARDDVIGRRTSTGAALGERGESQPVDLDSRTPAGRLRVPAHAHIRLAGTRNTQGARIYRRSWNFDDGFVDGERHAGLMFLAWQGDIRRGFLPIQRSLVQHDDALSRFIDHVGSAVFAVPARGDDDYPGQRLLEDAS